MPAKPKSTQTSQTSQTSPSIAALPEADPLQTLKDQHLALQNEHHAAVSRIRELEAQAADPLTVLLGNLDAGVVLADAGKQLSELCGAVVKREAAGTLTLKFTVKPFQANATVITADVSVKLPKAAPAPSIFYPKADGSLSKSDPRQTKFEFSDPDRSSPGTTKPYGDRDED